MNLFDDFYKRKKEENIRFCLFAAMIALAIVIMLSVFAVTVKADENIVAITIAAEACSEGEVGMQAVANTIKNRAIARRKTPAQIVTQKNQYYGATASNRHKLYAQCKATADRLAREIMTLPDVTGGAQYFLLPKEPVRKWHGAKTVKIGRHTFYKEA